MRANHLRANHLRLVLLSAILLVSLFQGGTPAVVQANPLPPGKVPSVEPFGEERPRTLVTSTTSITSDSFGYTVLDDSGQYAWKDTTGGSTVVFSDADDGVNFSPIPFGFTFPFYEFAFTDLFVSTNGLITFGEGNITPANTSLPLVSQPNELIAVLWDDLAVGGTLNSGKVVTKAGGVSPSRFFVIEWNNVTRLGSSQVLTFQAVLFENGDILLQYQRLDAVVDSATVGIEDRDGLVGIEFLYNETGLTAGSAVRFVRPTSSYRLKVLTPRVGEFTEDGMATFQLQLRNTGDKGSDSYEFTTPKNDWSFAYYQENGVIPLADTDGDGLFETGTVPQGNDVTVLMFLQPPDGVEVGDQLSMTVQVTSRHDPTVTGEIAVQSAVPASFAQVYVDTRRGAVIDLVWQENRIPALIDNWFSGSTLAVGPIMNGFLEVWEKNGTAVSEVTSTTVSFTNLEFSVINRYGTVEQYRVRLTDNEQLAVNNLEVVDRSPSVGASPGKDRAAIVWSRTATNKNDNRSLSNVYLAVVNRRGDVLVPETSITRNTTWGDPGALNLPYYDTTSACVTMNGHYVVAFEDERRHSGGDESRNIIYAVYDQSGAVVKGPSAVTASVPGDTVYGDPSLHCLDDNRAVLAFSRHTVASGSYAVMLTVFDSSGNTILTPQQVSGASGYRPDAVQFQDGKIMLAWTNSTGPGLQYVRLRGDTFAVIGSPASLNSPDGRLADNASVTMTMEKHAVVTWIDASAWNRLYYALIDSQGQVLSAPMLFYSGKEDNSLLLTSVAGQGNAPYDGRTLVYLPVVRR